jgi:hypothetical protein
MKTLNEKEWVAIPITGMFEKIIAGKGKGLNHLTKITDGVNYIGATNRNNGVMCSIADDELSNNLIQEGNCIGFIKNGDGSAGYAIYKREKFISTSDVIYGYADWLNSNSGIFFVAVQDMIEEKYSHGYKRNQQHLRGDKVMLPVTDDGKPDYDYMSEYVQEHKEAMLAKYRDYAEKQIAEIGDYVEIPALDEKEWNTFKAFGEDGLFVIETTNSSIDGIRLIDGKIKNIPYITRTDTNNGIARFVSDDNFSYGHDEAGCITVGLDTQTAFWQSHKFVTGQNIQVISGDKLNLFSAQFVIPLFRNQMKAKFNWGGNGATLGRMKRLELMLPTTDSGEPDFEYMEQYAKNMMLRKYQQYLSYLAM